MALGQINLRCSLELIEYTVESFVLREHTFLLTFQRLDPLKAFKCVNNKVMLNKLDHYGMRGIALSWL